MLGMFDQSITGRLRQPGHLQFERNVFHRAARGNLLHHALRKLLDRSLVIAGNCIARHFLETLTILERDHIVSFHYDWYSARLPVISRQADVDHGRRATGGEHRVVAVHAGPTLCRSFV